MMTGRLPRPLAAGVAAGLCLLVSAASARADLAGDIAADLTQSGVNVVSVSVETPPAATGPLYPDEAETSFEGLKPFLSPNPGAPLPIARITMRTPTGSPLTGVLTTPGLAGASYYDHIPAALRAELAAVEAVKHALARGASLTGIQLSVLNSGSSVIASDVLIAVPNAQVFPPAQSPASLMPRAELEGYVEQALPPWAVGADVEINVIEDAAGERVVEVIAHFPAQALRAINPADLTYTLDDLQVRLAAQGAKIGRTHVTLFDRATGDPLYASANDILWGQRAHWHSPLIAAFAGGAAAALPTVKTAGIETNDTPALSAPPALPDP